MYGVVGIDNDSGIAGLSKIHIYNTNVKTHMLPFKSKITAFEIASRYKMSSINILVEDEIFFD
jgi:hypothetical protein